MESRSGFARFSARFTHANRLSYPHADPADLQQLSRRTHAPNPSEACPIMAAMLIDPDGRPERCLECGGPAEHRHHVIPRSRGGTRTVPLCQDCHDLVHWRNDDTGSLIRHARLAAEMQIGPRRGRGAAAQEPSPEVPDAERPAPTGMVWLPGFAHPVSEADLQVTASDIERSRAEGDHPPEFYARLRAMIRARRR
jgi:hypothetical protein